MIVNGADDAIEVSGGNKLKNLFPGYYSPSKEERRIAYQRGLASFDANALLDLYRFSEKARNELFVILETLRPRLFITHQAVLEFYRNRVRVVESRLVAAEEKCKEIEVSLKAIVEKIQEFANRHQIDSAERDRLIGLVGELSSTLTESIRVAGTYDLTREQVRESTDAVLTRLASLSAGRVGNALSDVDHKQALKEAARRREEKIPPGYAEKKVSPELQAGDYILWRQLMNEALVHGRPVLLVSNEQKEDWVLNGPSGQILGPRPELVLEMQREAKVALHTVSVVGLLREAPEYLGITVSSSTIREAESIPGKRHVKYRFTDRSTAQYDSLSEQERVDLISALERFVHALETRQAIEDAPDVSSVRGKNNMYVLRWSREGRAVLLVDVYDPGSEFDMIVKVSQITKKKFSDDGLKSA